MNKNLRNSAKFDFINGYNTKQEQHISTGVYKLNFNDYPKFYIGQIGRSFKTLYSEALTQLLIKSNFAEHNLTLITLI